MASNMDVTIESVGGLEVFSGLPAESLAELLAAGRVRQVPARQSVSGAGASPEHYCFVLGGAVAVALRSDEVGAPVRDADAVLEYMAELDAGACFSNAFAGVRGAIPGPRVDCIATRHTTLLEVESGRIASMMARHDDWRRTLERQVGSARRHFLAQRDPARRMVQDFFLRENYSNSSVARVRRIDHCLDCNKCNDACAARHGAVRMDRVGTTLGRLAFPVACRKCHDKPCLPACGFGAISVDDTTGDVRISQACTGCGGCVVACSNGAIRMVRQAYTVDDFPEPLPLSNPHGMTNVPGLFVAGDVDGAALIRVAMNEAVKAVDAIGPRRTAPDPHVLDVAIVGGGPAGLSAALRCRERNLSYFVLEKGQLASTIQEYPKQKHVMAEPSSVPLLSSLWFEDCSKEELIERWRQAVQEQQVQLMEGAEVKQIEERDGLFELHLDQGVLRAEHVVLCIGKRGSPRKLGLAGESFPRVRYSLSDPGEWAQRSVLVVGGGDSALEAAVSLADVPGTRVLLSYRRDAFQRAKALNRRRIEEREAEGKLEVLLKSTVVALEPESVLISTESGDRRVDNDVVFALLGAEPPTGFLSQAGIRVLQPGTPEMAQYAASRGERQQAVKCDGCAGYEEQACLTACPTGALVELRADDLFLEPNVQSTTRQRRFSGAPFIDGVRSEPKRSRTAVRVHRSLIALTVLGLVVVGAESFLRSKVPEYSLTAMAAGWAGEDWPATFSSGRGLGHWLGYIGTSLMLVSLVYSLRTRVFRFARLGSQSVWLSAHLWLGFAGGTLVTYHSALKLDRWASIACILIWAIVVTGAAGRYLYGRVQSVAGLAEFELSALRRRCAAWARGDAASWATRVLFKDPTDGAVQSGTLVVLLWHELRDRVALGWLWAYGARRISDRGERRELLRGMKLWAASRRRASYYQGAQALLRHWNIIHIVLAILMFVLAGIHIVYGFMYKAV